MRISSNMISKGMEDIKNNPYFKKKVEEEEKTEKSKGEKDVVENESIMLSKNLMAEQVKDTVVLSKIGPTGHKEQIKTLDSTSAEGRQLTKMIDKENMTEEEKLQESVKEIAMNSKRLSLVNYL